MNSNRDSHKATRTQSRTKKKLLSVLSLLVFCANPGLAQQHKGALRGQLMDELGGVITATKVTLINAEGSEVSTTTDDRGVFSFEDLPAARYTVKVTARGFAPFEKTDVIVGTSARTSLELKLTVTIGKQQVTVTTNS